MLFCFKLSKLIYYNKITKYITNLFSFFCHISLQINALSSYFRFFGLNWILLRTLFFNFLLIKLNISHSQLLSSQLVILINRGFNLSFLAIILHYSLIQINNLFQLEKHIMKETVIKIDLFKESNLYFRIS